MTSNRADAIFQWQTNILLNKTRIRPMPKDYPNWLIEIHKQKITLQVWNKLLKYLYKELRSNFTIEQLFHKIKNICNKE